MTQTRTGWALGGGLNYALTNNFFVKTEGIYYDLGRSSLTVNGTGTTSCITAGSVAGCGGASYAGVATPVAGYTVQRRFNGVIASLGAGIKFRSRRSVYKKGPALPPGLFCCAGRRKTLIEPIVYHDPSPTVHGLAVTR